MFKVFLYNLSEIYVTKAVGVFILASCGQPGCNNWEILNRHDIIHLFNIQNMY